MAENAARASRQTARAARAETNALAARLVPIDVAGTPRAEADVLAARLVSIDIAGSARPETDGLNRATGVGPLDAPGFRGDYAAQGLGVIPVNAGESSRSPPDNRSLLSTATTPRTSLDGRPRGGGGDAAGSSFGDVSPGMRSSMDGDVRGRRGLGDVAFVGVSHLISGSRDHIQISGKTPGTRHVVLPITTSNP